MIVVSSREFVTNQKRYFDMAVNENILIKRGKNRFRLVYTNMDNTNIPEQPILEPDEDLQRAITIDELREKMHKRIHELFANK